MGDKRNLKTNDGYQPVQKGYQPAPSKVSGGYQPTTSEHKPANTQPPPKKP